MSSLASAATTLYSALSGAPTRVQFQNSFGVLQVAFDAVISESYVLASKPTEYPVEDGGTVADTMIRSPMAISLTGFVSDTPFDETLIAAEALTVAATMTLPPMGIIAGAAAFATWQASKAIASPSQAAFAKIVALQLGDPDASPPKSPEPFRFVSRLGVFENMMITSLSVPRDAQTGNGLVFQVDLVRIKIATQQSLDLTVMDAPSLAAAKKDAGEQKASSSSLIENGGEGFAAGRPFGDKGITSLARPLGIAR